MSRNYKFLFEGNQKDNIVIYMYNNKNSYELSESLKTISEIAFETDFFLKEIKPIQTEKGFELVLVYENKKLTQSKCEIEELITTIKTLKNEIDDVYRMFDNIVKEIDELKAEKNKEKENG
ncbi:hypothetical protein [Fusobacterium vincentii]|uniref:Uncharacterized protein n=1 Tax=Fusobacterium vincentii TaxID=155615 RepID=A0AAJ1CRW7_FUSVC|nr:hypothetical protein [Fusobacterium vincentii]MCW0263114.1 hypothetical protein [Fusobacterium vincentii]STO29945.1 Uncharacterised protein [Fusobacterium vincentii]